MRKAGFLAVLLTLAGLAACNSSNNGPKTATVNHAKIVTPIDAATAGTITGTVKFDGPAPKVQRIDMTQDPGCGAASGLSEAVVVSDGNLANVFVYVKSGLGDRGFTAPQTPVEIKQQGCRYVPHVAAAMTGQPVKFSNADPTTHNIHPMPKDSPQWNASELPNTQPIVKAFERQEIMIPVKCNQHPWMKMFLNVVDSPFYAVTGPDGRFELKGLPPGEYTIAAVHERFGERDVKVTVGPKQTQDVSFAFNGAVPNELGR